MRELVSAVVAAVVVAAVDCTYYYSEYYHYIRHTRSFFVIVQVQLFNWELLVRTDHPNHTFENCCC